MRIWISFLILLAVFAGGAWATCLFDHETFSDLLVNGDESGAKSVAATVASRADCGCDKPDAPCLRLGPEGSDVVSLADLLTGIKQVGRWRKSLGQTCGRMPQTNDKEREEKLGCFNRNVEQFQNISKVHPMFFKITEKIGASQAKNLRDFFNRRKNAVMKAEQDSPAYRNTLRAQKIASELCELIKQQRILIERKSNQDRQMTYYDSLNKKLPLRTEYRIKENKENVTRLKTEFESVYGQSFFVLEWCQD